MKIISLKNSYLIAFIIAAISLIKIINLSTVPLFADEALYCGLGQEFTAKPFLEVWSMTVGYWKVAPMLSLIQAGVLGLLPCLSPLFACRLVSVLTSAIAATVLYLLVRNICKDHLVQFASVVFILLNPFSFFVDRTGMQESLLNLMAVLAFYLVYKAMQSGKSIDLLGVAILLLAGFLTKLNFYFLIPALIALVITQKKYKQKYWLSGVIVFASLAFFWWSGQHTGLWQTAAYHTKKPEVIWEIIDRIRHNFRLSRSWYVQYLTPVFFISVIIGSWQMRRNKLWIWVIIPLLLLSVYLMVSTSYFPRYLLITLPFWAIVVGFSCKSKIGKLIFMGLIILFVIKDWQIIFTPAYAQIAKEDHFQFYEDWTCGEGINLALSWLSSQPEITDVFVPNDLYYSFQIYKQSFYRNLPIRQHRIACEDDAGKSCIEADFKNAVVLLSGHSLYIETLLRQRFILSELYSSHKDSLKSILIKSITPNKN